MVPHLHVNLVVTGLLDYHFGWHQQVPSFIEKIDEIFKDLQNMLGIADNILIVEYGHRETMTEH